MYTQFTYFAAFVFAFIRVAATHTHFRSNLVAKIKPKH